MYLTAVSQRKFLFFSFIDIYCVIVSGCEDFDSSLSKATLGLFAAVHKTIMYMSPTAKCHMVHRSSFCVPFPVRQRKNMSYFPMPVRGKYGDVKSQMFGESNYCISNWIGLFFSGNVHEI